ncbi:MAG: hypothetical protein KBD65_02830 [Candidatus Moranbacteria bacterium]|nr:hypothetical protein [Candidatus Moranbacteria bacterium]
MARPAKLTSLDDFKRLRGGALPHLVDSDEDEQRERRPEKTIVYKRPTEARGTEHDHLPVLTCLAQPVTGCKKTFQLPWGYRDDGKKPNDPAKRLWSGVCGVECSMALDELAKERSRAEEAAFLAKFGLS